MTKGGYVYMLASRKNGTLYIGVTANIVKRMDEHKAHSTAGFTSKYHVDQLVWCEEHETIESAIMREKQMKKWYRAWKIALIEKENPGWRDLTDDF
jgi:putative endonuclease